MSVIPLESLGWTQWTTHFGEDRSLTAFVDCDSDWSDWLVVNFALLYFHV